MKNTCNEKYTKLKVGERYRLFDHNTNTSIVPKSQVEEITNTFGDNKVLINTSDGCFARLSESVKVVDGYEYVLASKKPCLIFEGPVRDRCADWDPNRLKNVTSDWDALIKHLDDLGLPRVSPTEEMFLFDMYGWQMEHQAPVNLHELFNRDISWHPFSGNPIGAADDIKRRMFLVTLLTGRTELARFIYLDDLGGELKIHLADDSFMVMSGDMSILDKYNERFS